MFSNQQNLKFKLVTYPGFSTLKTGLINEKSKQYYFTATNVQVGISQSVQV